MLLVKKNELSSCKVVPLFWCAARVLSHLAHPPALQREKSAEIPQGRPFFLTFLFLREAFNLGVLIILLIEINFYFT